MRDILHSERLEPQHTVVCEISFLFFIHCVLTPLFECRTFYQAAETLSPPDSITKHSIEARQKKVLLLYVDFHNECTLAL